MFIGYLTFTLITAIIRQSSCSCVVEQTHITLGDKYSLEQTDSDHALTIGFVTSECKSMPIVKLHVKDGSDIDLDHFTEKTADYQIIDQSLPDKRSVTYLKTALFFKVTDGHLAKAASWSVYHGGTMVEGPINFPTRFRSTQDSFRIFVVADMDLSKESESTVAKIRDIKDDDYDMFVHVGDYAYEIEDYGGRSGDEFFQEMSKTSKRIPYLAVPGNHESYEGGNLFNYRFRMPNINDKNLTTGNHIFDFVFKGTYFIVVDFDYIMPSYKKPGDPAKDIFDWMTSRLEILKGRVDITWKVLISHRPFSCSEWSMFDCPFNMYWLRVYEDLLSKHGFHVLLQAHNHIYTRSKPLRGIEIMPDSKIGSGAMVSIIDGHSGTKHRYLNESDEQLSWSRLTAEVDASGPTYLTVEVGDSIFATTLVRSDTGEVRDRMSIDRNTLNDRKLKIRSDWMFVVGLLSLLLVALVLTGIWIIRRCCKEKSDIGRKIVDNCTVESYNSVDDTLPTSEQYA